MSALIVALGEAWVGVEGNDIAELNEMEQHILTAHCMAGVRAVLSRLAEIGPGDEAGHELAAHVNRSAGFRAALRNLSGGE